MDTVESHKKFKERLASSELGRWYIARWFSRLGWGVSMAPSYAAPQFEDRKAYSDNGDLVINRGERLERVEVKHLSVSFTSADDWPFKDFIVDGKESFDSKKKKPDYYVVVSNDFMALAILSVSTRESWNVEKRADKNCNGHQKDYYVANKETPLYHKLDQKVANMWQQMDKGVF